MRLPLWIVIKLRSVSKHVCLSSGECFSRVPSNSWTLDTVRLIVWKICFEDVTEQKGRSLLILILFVFLNAWEKCYIQQIFICTIITYNYNSCIHASDHQIFLPWLYFETTVFFECFSDKRHCVLVWRQKCLYLFRMATLKACCHRKGKDLMLCTNGDNSVHFQTVPPRRHS